MTEFPGNYFENLSRDQLNRFGELAALYSEWNEKINVISRKDISNFNVHHLLHSLAIGKIINFKTSTKVLDIGTGGGFPGIPLAILFPDVEFTLLDSIRKKTMVAKSVANDLGLNNVEVIWGRAEEIDIKVDFVVSRAVTSFPRFVEWTRGKFLSNSFNDLNNGILYLKGGDLSEELSKFSKKVRVIELTKYFNESFFEEKKLVYLPMVK